MLMLCKEEYLSHVCVCVCCVDEDQLLLDELNEIMSRESQRRMSTSALPSIAGGDTVIPQDEEPLVHQKWQHQSIMLRPVSCTGTVFPDKGETVLLDLNSWGERHFSAGFEDESMDSQHLFSRRKRCLSAGSAPTPTVCSLGKLMEERRLVRCGQLCCL